MQTIPKWGTGLTPLLAFGGLLAGLQMAQPSWLSEPGVRPAVPVPSASTAVVKTLPIPITEPVLGFIDVRDGKPVLFANEGSQVQVSGWAACSVPGSTLSRVAVLIDGIKRAETAQFLPRPDVAVAYGRPDFERSGWKISVSVSGLEPGGHTLTVQGFGSKGEKGELPSFRLNILQ